MTSIQEADSSSIELETLDIDSLNDTDSIQKAIDHHKTRLYEKYKFLGQINQAKKDTASSYREQLAEIKEEVDYELHQLDALHDKLKILNAS
jgi:hypothetical protein